MKNQFFYVLGIAWLIVILGFQPVNAQFNHPGLTQSKAELDTIKAKVKAKVHPWIDSWNNLLVNPSAANTYTARPSSDIGGTDGTRQQAQRDAEAAYLNALRWYVTGDVSYANCAVRILNAWTGTVNKPVTGQLFMLSAWGMVSAGELLRLYPGWSSTDFSKFKNMCLNYFYPSCRDFRERCGSWPGWDGPANVSCMEIAVLCDDTVKFNDAIRYFKTGGGGGCLTNAIRENGQTTEMGRDAPHSEIGINSFADVCHIALNQGIDLYSYGDNRLLKGYEFFCKFNLNNPVDWIYYPDCNGGQNFYFPAMRYQYRVYGWDAYVRTYNYYTLKKGLDAPYTRKMIKLRGIIGLNAMNTNCADTTTLFNALPAPPVPEAFTALAGVKRVTLRWKKPDGDIASGFYVLRSTVKGGPYTNISTWTFNTSNEYVDTDVVNDKTYYYKVYLTNRTTRGGNSAEASATPVSANSTMPVGWTMQDVGAVAKKGSTTYSPISGNTFIVNGSGADIWGNDSYGYTYTKTTGDCVLTTRVYDAIHDPDILKTKIGIMMRETLDPNSKNTTVHVGGVETRQAAFSFRSDDNGGTAWRGGNLHTWTPGWFRLQRTGNKFIGSQSSDGKTWFKIDSATISMSSTYYVGMLVCGGSQDPNYTARAEFDSVTVSGAGTVPNAPANFKGIAMNSSRINLSWTANANAACYEIQRSTSANGPFVTIASSVPGATFSDANLTASTMYYYVLKSANSKGLSADSSQIAIQTPELTLPNTPMGLTAVESNGIVTLTWSAADKADGYVIRRASVSAGPYDSIATVTVLRYADNKVTKGSSYYYKVSGYNALGQGSLSSAINVFVPVKLSGTKIGTPGSYNNNSSTTFGAALDGNIGTFFDANVASDAWVGIDLGRNNRGVVTRVRFAPRSGYQSRMVGGVFQGSTKADFSTPVTLCTITAEPASGVYTDQPVTITSMFRYLRYVTPANAWGNVAEVEFLGKPVALTDQTITFNPLQKKALGDVDFSPGATASSGLTVSYTSSDTKVATIFNGKIHIVGAGSCNILADQIGNTVYGTALQVSQMLQVDSVPSAVKNLADNSMYRLFPNPVKDQLMISSDGTKQLNLEIYSITGTKVYSENISGLENSINVGKLSKGLYLVKLNDGVNIYTARVIKE